MYFVKILQEIGVQKWGQLYREGLKAIELATSVGN